MTSQAGGDQADQVDLAEAARLWWRPPGGPAGLDLRPLVAGQAWGQPVDPATDPVLVVAVVERDLGRPTPSAAVYLVGDAQRPALFSSSGSWTIRPVGAGGGWW